MDDRPLPKFPTESVRELERKAALKEPPDRFVDQFRHAWFRYLLIAVSLVVFSIAAVVAFEAEAHLLLVFVVLVPVITYLYFRIRHRLFDRGSFLE
jgi:uncharacterized membrane protein YoaK (UPF0700 family)